MAEDSQKNLQICKNKINNLENEIEAIKLVNSIRKTELINVNKELLTLERENKILNGILKDKVIIIEEYKSKNDMVLGQLKEYEKLLVKLDRMEKERDQLNLVALEATSSLREKEAIILGLKDSINNLMDNNKLETDRAIELHIQ